MTLKDIEKVYGIKKVEGILAMMGAGWSSEDTAEDIYKYFEVEEGFTMEDAEEIAEIIKELETAISEE